MRANARGQRAQNSRSHKIKIRERFQRRPSYPNATERSILLEIRKRGVSRRLALTRGALRDRHERGARDAMDAMGQRTVFVRTTDLMADGEVVWSWHPDTDAKSRRMMRGDGGEKAGSRGEREGHR
jgi:hypothetical protein